MFRDKRSYNEFDAWLFRDRKNAVLIEENSLVLS